MKNLKLSIYKSITWKLLGFIILSFITFIVTDNLLAVSEITIMYQITMFVLYILHEQLWYKVLKNE